MGFGLKISIQTAIYALIGAVFGYLTVSRVPSNTLGELLKLLGGVTAVAGSLLGWSAGWLDQSRGLVKEIDYNAAVRLFQELGESQKKLIWRWGIALASSIIVVVSSLLVKSTTLPLLTVQISYIAALGFLSIALLSIFSLFRSMLNSAKLKAHLEEYEREELRRLRNTPKEIPAEIRSKEVSQV